MHLAALILDVFAGGIFVGGALYSAFKRKAPATLKEWLAATGYVLVAVGGFGFFGTAFSSLGGFRWVSASFEWPVGFAHNIIDTTDGTHVVPVREAGGRLQIYSPAWVFIRGWYRDPNGTDFTVLPAESNKVEIIVRKGSMRYLFNLNGELICQSSYAPKKYMDFSDSGQSADVPTRWWLWMFTSPFHSWIILAIGGVLVLLTTSKKTMIGGDIPHKGTRDSPNRVMPFARDAMPLPLRWRKFWKGCPNGISALD